MFQFTDEIRRPLRLPVAAYGIIGWNWSCSCASGRSASLSSYHSPAFRTISSMVRTRSLRCERWLSRRPRSLQVF
jgi:hypothetical protein